MRARALALALGVAALLTPAPAQAAGVEITVNNFRFCLAEQCGATDSAFVPGPGGPPLAPVYNPLGVIVDVEPGQTVTWVYRDSFCDQFNTPPLVCPGHEVRFEDEGLVGFMPARSGPTSVSWTAPADAAPGSALNYFCTVSNHYVFGMTGALRIVEPQGGPGGVIGGDDPEVLAGRVGDSLPRTGVGLPVAGPAGLALAALAGRALVRSKHDEGPAPGRA